MHLEGGVVLLRTVSTTARYLHSKFRVPAAAKEVRLSANLVTAFL